jgi:molybdopterin synthase sulfur carrier subunit
MSFAKNRNNWCASWPARAADGSTFRDMLQLRYFASLRETLGTAAEQVELPAGIDSVSDLARWLQARGAPWEPALADRHLQVAVNQAIVKPDAPVRDGDEVAWFPPVTGG